MGRAHRQQWDASRQLALLDHAERIGGLGSWEWLPDRGELVWSDNHFRLFHLEPQSFIPSPEFVVSHVHADDRRRVADALRALARGERREVEYRICLDDGTMRWLRATIAGFDEPDDDPTRLVGSVQDVTLQRHLDRQLSAHVAVTEGLAAWESLEQGAATLVDRLRDALDVPFGAFWVRDGQWLEGRAVRAAPRAEGLDRLVEITLATRLGVGAPVVGVAYATRLPVITAEPDDDAGVDARRSAIRDAGIRAAMAIPAVHGNETLAVLEFLSHEPIPATQQLLRTASGIGHEIGYFLSRRRREVAEPPLSPRELEVLQLAAHGRAAPAIASELGISPATVKRHFEQAYSRLGVTDRAAAVAEAMRHGWIT